MEAVEVIGGKGAVRPWLPVIFFEGKERILPPPPTEPDEAGFFFK
jgi:hypothetical protein